MDLWHFLELLMVSLLSFAAAVAVRSTFYFRKIFHFIFLLGREKICIKVSYDPKHESSSSDLQTSSQISHSSSIFGSTLTIVICSCKTALHIFRKYLDLKSFSWPLSNNYMFYCNNNLSMTQFKCQFSR